MLQLFDLPPPQHSGAEAGVLGAIEVSQSSRPLRILAHPGEGEVLRRLFLRACALEPIEVKPECPLLGDASITDLSTTISHASCNRLAPRLVMTLPGNPDSEIGLGSTGRA
jgi:hypothetical protein